MKLGLMIAEGILADPRSGAPSRMAEESSVSENHYTMRYGSFCMSEEDTVIPSDEDLLCTIRYLNDSRLTISV